MARLPNPGSDDGIWGNVLNEFLSQSHDSKGDLKSNVVGPLQLQSNSVGSAKIIDGSVESQKLSSGVSAAIGYALSGTITTDYTAQPGQIISADATAATVVVSLPPATRLGDKIVVTKVDSSSNTVSIVASGSDTIEGRSSTALTIQSESITLRGNGAGSWVRESGGALHDAVNTLNKGLFVGRAGGTTPLLAPSPFINVRDFGAVGDGTTNDLPAIQAAVNAAAAMGIGCVVIPRSNAPYIKAGTLTIPSNIALEGRGRPILKHPDAASGAGYLGIVNADSANGNDYISLRGFILDCNSSNRPTATESGIRIIAGDSASCSRITVEDVEVRNVPAAAIQLMNVDNYCVRNCRIDSTGRDGITIWFNSYDGVIANNIVTNVGDDCIALNSEAGTHVATQIKRVTITGNTVGQDPACVYGSGINVAGAEDVSVSGNVIDYAQAWGIIAQGGLVSGAALPSRRVSISGNTIRSAGRAASGGGGIATSNTYAVTVSGNSIPSYYGNGIQCAVATTVQGNYVGTGQTASSSGISITGAFTSVVGNFIDRAAGHGIQAIAEKVTITGNTLDSIGVLNAGAAGVLINGNVNRVLISSNTIRRTTSGTYGIRIATGTGADNIVMGNICQGQAAGNGISNGSSGSNVLVNNIAP